MKIVLIASNKKDAGVFNIATDHGIGTFILTKENFLQSEEFLWVLKKASVDFVILAGFLWKVPVSLVHAYNQRIINIHPALLPKYGGKGMYGHLVHEAVFLNKEKETGITIHYVNEHYDEGTVIFQSSVLLNDDDTPSTIEKKVRELEMKYLPAVIEKEIRELGANS